MRRCPRFQRCNVPVCPLDPLQDQRTYLKGEPRCQLPKSRRIRLAEPTNLPRQGMTKREWAAHQSWTAMDEEQRLARKSGLQERNRDLHGESEREALNG